MRDETVLNSGKARVAYIDHFTCVYVAIYIYITNIHYNKNYVSSPCFSGCQYLKS